MTPRRFGQAGRQRWAGRTTVNPDAEDLRKLMCAKLKILIAEDDKTARMYYDESLSDKDFDKKFMTSGKEALAAYRKWKPDIIVLDIMLEEMTGYTVLKEIRLGGDKSTTIIMATSLAGKSDILDCFHLGIQGYIVKPFDLRTLRDKILQYHRRDIT